MRNPGAAPRLLRPCATCGRLGNPYVERLCHSCGSPRPLPRLGSDGRATTLGASGEAGGKPFRHSGWPALRLAIVTFALAEVSGAVAGNRLVVPRLLAGATFGDFASLRAELALLIYGTTTAAAFLAGLLALGGAQRRGGGLASPLVRAVLGIAIAFAAGLAAATFLRLPIAPAGFSYHVLAAAGGLLLALAAVRLLPLRGSAPASASGFGQRLAAGMLSIGLVTLPVSGGTASSSAPGSRSDINVGECPLTSIEVKVEAGISLLGFDLGPNFDYTAVQHPGNAWSLDAVAGASLGYEYDVGGLVGELVATATGVKLSVTNSAVVSLTNHYEFASGEAMEHAVEAAFVRVASVDMAFPGLAEEALIDPGLVGLPPSPETEVTLGGDTKIEAGAGVPILGALNGSVHVGSAVHLVLKDPTNRDLFVSKPEIIKIGFDLNGGAEEDVAALGASSNLSGEGKTTIYLSLSLPKLAADPTGFTQAPELSIETTLDASAAVGVDLGGLVPGVPKLGLTRQSGVSETLSGSLGELTSPSVDGALAVLVKSLSSQIRDERGQRLAVPPSQQQFLGALRTLYASSEATLMSERSDAGDAALELGVESVATLSAEGSIGRRVLVNAIHKAPGGDPIKSLSCRAAP